MSCEGSKCSTVSTSLVLSWSQLVWRIWPLTPTFRWCEEKITHLWCLSSRFFLFFSLFFLLWKKGEEDFEDKNNPMHLKMNSWEQKHDLTSHNHSLIRFPPSKARLICPRPNSWSKGDYGKKGGITLESTKKNATYPIRLDWFDWEFL